MSHRRVLEILSALTVVAAVITIGSARATTHESPWCRAPSSNAWRHVVARHVVPLSRTTPLNPIALANGGRSFFAEIHTKRFTGVAEIKTKTGAITRIKAFPDPSPAIGNESADQAAGAFDGRWLVWHEYRGETSHRPSKAPAA